jgi:hypothetical protein
MRIDAWRSCRLSTIPLRMTVRGNHQRDADGQQGKNKDFVWLQNTPLPSRVAE